MIFTVPLQAGTTLANVRYIWIAAGVAGPPISSGITQPSSTFAVFRIDAVPPANAEELIVYDSTDTGNWNTGAYAVAAMPDSILNRNISGGSSVGRQVKQALAFLRNKWTLIGGTLTVYDIDDITVLWTAVITADPNAQPVTGSKPT